MVRPFDLQELADTPGLDVNNVTYVRIVDVVGCIDSQYATHDSKGDIVNDPWPTPYATCGFDLDAVGVINAKMPSAINDWGDGGNTLYPNPVKQGNTVFIETQSRLTGLEINDLSGRLVSQLGEGDVRSNNLAEFNTGQLSAGIYFIQATTLNTHFISKLIVE